MPRSAAALCLLLALVSAGCGSKSNTAATPSAGTPNGIEKSNDRCRSIPHPGGLKAVFGRRSSAASAEALRRQAEGRGFKGLDIEERGCGNFYVTLAGLTDAKQFAAFKAEARSAGYSVTLRCEPAPDDGGDTEAVFGVTRTYRLAVSLRRLVVERGFVGAEIEQEACDRWSVVVDGLTSDAMQKDFAAEARSAGFTVTFRPS